jgi:hypothetical protein
MRRFLISLFVLSIIATAGVYYWRTYLPEASVQAPASETAPGDAATDRATRSLPKSFGTETTRTFKAPSERQDLAMMISILSSVISAVAAVAQTLLTARAYRR